MTDKERHIINFLTNHYGQAHYIDIRKNVGHHFEDEAEFDNVLELLVFKNCIFETDFGSTLYQIKTK